MKTQIHDLARDAQEALEAWPRSGADRLVALLADEVHWLVDWKGEGVFEHSTLFGRSEHRGTAAVADFFAHIARHRRPDSVEVTRSILSEDEAVLLGNVRWAASEHGDEETAGSDFSLRLALVDGAVTTGRFLTLPDGHLETFVPDHRTSEELDSDRIAGLVRDFQKLYFDAYLLGKTWSETYWMGTPVFKCPLDLWIYQELIVELRPDVVVETGTCAGGSAYYLAQMCELVGHGEVLTIDVQPYKDPQPEHARLTYLLGFSTADEILAQVRERLPAGGTVLVVLDSDHGFDNVYRELHAYADLVSVGSYLVVEDSNLNGHPTKPNFGPGPMEAIDRFLGEDARFRIDKEREKFLVTWNPRGYLLKTRA